MADGWSPFEVEATVADYFDMLTEEMHGRDYNKTAHRRTLRAFLNDRSDAAIELKHQNISAILNELGFRAIDGYKPRSNYQRLLYEVVDEHLERRPDLRLLLQREVAEPAAVPTVDDILAVLVTAPSPEARPHSWGEARERPATRPKVDYLALEARNRSLGLAGEEFVVRYEIARLESEGAGRLASKIEHVAKTRGDGLGFDVLSYEADGRDRFIEVKTTAYGPSTPFYVTPNEANVSARERERFHLYRPFSFRRAPKLFMKPGPIGESFDLIASEFRATIR